MWTWRHLIGSTSLERIVIAELWGGLIVYLSRGSGNVGPATLLVSLATLGLGGPNQGLSLEKLGC